MPATQKAVFAPHFERDANEGSNQYSETKTICDFSEPIPVQFRNQQLSLYTIYQKLAFILSVTGVPQSPEQARSENYWVWLLATYSRWNNLITSEPEDVPFASSLCVLPDKSGDPSAAFPLIMSCSGPSNKTENLKLRAMTRKMMDEAGFVDPLIISNNKLLKNYGACAECWQWKIIK